MRSQNMFVAGRPSVVPASYVGHRQLAPTSSTTVALPTGTLAGDMIVAVAFGGVAGTGVYSTSILTSQGWTFQEFADLANGRQQTLMWRLATSAEATAGTFDCTGVYDIGSGVGATALDITTIRNVKNAAYKSKNISSGTTTTVSFTPSSRHNGVMVMNHRVLYTSGTITPPTGFTGISHWGTVNDMLYALVKWTGYAGGNITFTRSTSGNEHLTYALELLG